MTHNPHSFGRRPKPLSSGRHRKPTASGFHPAGIFKDVPVFGPVPGFLIPEILSLILNYPDSTFVQNLLLQTQSFSLSATLPSIEVSQNQRLDSGVTQLFVVLPSGTLDNPGSLFPTALSLAITLNDSVMSQGQSLIPSTLQLNLGLPNGTLVQPLRLTPSATTLFLSLPNSLMRLPQVLTPSALTLNTSIPASTLDQNTAPWTFQNIGTDLWLRGTDNVTLVGANVTDWGDVKTPTLTATQTVAANQPITATLDGKPVVSTVGGKYLDLPNTLQIRSAAFLVNNFQASSSGAQVCVVFGENDPIASSTDYVFIFIGPDYTISVDGNTGLSGCASLNGNPITCGTNILLEETYSAGGGPAIFYVDWGGAQVSVDYISAFNPQSGIFQGSLEIAEIILSPEVLSFADQERAVGRLAHDWGQTGLLPANHPYKTEEPTLTLLQSSVLILNSSFPVASLVQNQRLETSILTLNSSIPDLALSQNQRLVPTVLNLTATLPTSVLSQPTTQVLPTTALTLNAAAPSATLIQPEILTPTTLSLSATLPASSVTQDSGSEFISESGVSLRADQLQDATVMGDVDWWIAGVDEKLNGTEISVSGGTVTTSTGAPIFKFNDGTTNTGDQQLTAQYQFGSTPPLTTIAIPAGSGRVSVWVGTGSVNDASVQASFGSNFTGIVNFSNNARFDIDFIAASASTMAVTISAGSNADAGFYAVALATDSILTGTPAPDILWWPTTEAAGTNLNDPINGWIGFFEGSTISWDVDNFLLWAGGYVRNNNNALESLIETTFTGTAMCWVRPDNLTDDMCIFTAKHNTTNEGRMYFLRTDPVGFLNPAGVRMYKGGYRSDPVSGAQGVQFESKNEDLTFGWQHIAMSFATGSQPTPRFQFWKNGVQLAQGDFASYPTQFPDGPIHSQGNFMYGLQGNIGRNFLGKMYDLRLYARELETIDIQRIFDATRDVVGVT